MLCGVGLSALGFFSLSLVDSLSMLYAVMVLGVVLGSSLGFYVPISVVVASLFRARRSLAFGIFRMGPGLSGALVPVVGWFIVRWGWTSTTAVFMPFMVIYSLAYGGLASLQEPIRADYFGTRYFASIQGYSRLILAGGTFLGPLVAGLFYDLTQSYALPFAFFAVVSLVATLCMVWARAPQPENPL